MKNNDTNSPVNLNVDSIQYSKENEELVKSGFWAKTKKFAGKVPFTRDAVAMYYCAMDARTPLWAKGIAFGALAYFITPIDAIPDALIAMGFTDDAAVIMAGFRAISSQVKDEHLDKAEMFFK
ncbi:YkvA family protein [Paenibacillus wynnii]|uniref:YkvA family protein n=1 Tax=Paenibacillus wynnii TaxID=268407 RepID=UPI00068D2AFD|nr:YkvA family protein [Paenibacillus wynnii]